MEDQLWEMGLPLPEDLTPLTQSLISPQLALAFGITSHNFRVQFDINRVMHDNCSTICPREQNLDFLNLTLDTSSKTKRVDCFGADEVNSGPKDDDFDENGLNQAVKRPRLVWTPKLHQRFVDVIDHLGIENAVPKTIMEMMNVDGLTRENVASHLQKYRLYLKRMDGVSSEGNSSSKTDSFMFDSEQTSKEQILHCNSLPLMPMPRVPTPGPGPGLGLGPYYGPLGLPVNSPGYFGLESGGYTMFWNPQRG